MKYTVKGTVTLNWQVEVNADCEEEAMEKVENMYLSVGYNADGSVDIEDAEITGDDDNFEIYEVEESED